MINQNDQKPTNLNNRFSEKEASISQQRSSSDKTVLDTVSERNQKIQSEANTVKKANGIVQNEKTDLDADHGWRKTIQGKPFLISLAIHLLFFIIVLLIISRMPNAGTPFGERSTDSVGIVFSDKGGDGREKMGAPYEEQTSAKSSAEKEKTDPQKYEIPDNPVSENFLPKRDLLGATQKKEQGSLIKITTDVGQGSLSDRNSNQGNNGPGLGKGSGGQTVSFSDVKGNGRKFVYVLDRSESMSWSNGYPMKYALSEARASITSLNPEKGAWRFQIVVYNHEARSFGKETLLPVNEQNKNLVMKFLDTIFPQGGTDPVAAMEMAVKMSPDVIFFLTDADEEIPALTLERIHDMARSGKVRQIHVIEFGKSNDKVKTSFRQMAHDNNGQYIFKKID